MVGQRLQIVGGLLVLALTLAACGTPAPSPSGTPDVDEAQATEIAQNALEALNAGDYAAWSRDWDEAMKAAIKEPDFQAFRTSVLDNLGRYVAIRNVEYSSVKPGTYRWTFTVAFERGEGRLGFGFAQGSPLVAGVHSS